MKKDFNIYSAIVMVTCLIGMSVFAQNTTDLSAKIIDEVNQELVELSPTLGGNRIKYPKKRKKVRYIPSSDEMEGYDSDTITITPRNNNRNNNKSSGGIQIVKVNAGSTQQSKQNSSNASSAKQGVDVSNATKVAQDSNVSFLRRERIRQELNNETRLIEKLEQGRIKDEKKRSNAIEDLKTTVAHSTPVVQDKGVEIIPVGNAVPTETVYVGGHTSSCSTGNCGESTVVVESHNPSSPLSQFWLTPMVGIRDYKDSGKVYENSSSFLVGVALEGNIYSVLGIEGSFLYGRDKLKSKNNGYGFHNGNHHDPFNSFNSHGNYNHSQYGNGYDNRHGHHNGGFDPYSNNFGSHSMTRQTFEFAANLKARVPFWVIKPYGLVGGAFKYSKYDNHQNNNGSFGFFDPGFKGSTTKALLNVGLGVDSTWDNFGVGARVVYQKVLNGDNDTMNHYYGDSEDRYYGVLSASLIF